MKGNWRAHTRELWFALILLAAGCIVALRLRVETSMVPLLPPATRELSTLAQQVIESNLSKSMVLSIGPRPELSKEQRHTSAERAMKVARAMASDLAKHPEVAWVRTGPTPELERAFHQLYFPRRFNFVAPDAKALDVELAPAGLASRLEELKKRLAGPTGPLVRQLAPEDPLSWFLTQVERVQSAAPQRLQVRQGQFTADDGHAIVFLGLEHSALDATAQKPLLEAIRGLFAEHAHDQPTLVLEQSGVSLFAVDSEARISTDITRVAVFSSLGIALLFLVLFRRLSSLLMAALPLLTGFLMALAVCSLLFEQVHGLTLAFGASLLGVCIDYPVHLMNHRGAAQQGGAGVRVPKAVRSGLCLGAITTVVGISALALSGFRVMQQVAVFSGVGLLSALAVTLWILPRWPDRAHPALRQYLARGLTRIVSRLARRRSVLVSVCALPAVLGALGLTQARWAASLEGLAPLSPALRAEDGRVRARVGGPGTNDLVLAVGDTAEQALAANERAFAKLEAAQRSGLIADFRSLHSLVWSTESQRRSFVRSTAPQQAAALRLELERAGFQPDGFEAYFEQHKSTTFQPLTLAELQSSPMGGWLQQFVTQGSSRTLILSFPTLKQSAEALAVHLKNTPGVFFINQRELLNQAYRDLRERVSWLMLVGAGLMMALVFLRFRKLQPSLATLAPAAVAPLAALGILGLIGCTLNLFHLFAALVVLSMAMDYGIFLGEVARAKPHHSDAASWTLLSIVIAATTTCLSFGLLGFSSVPVLEAIGQTVALGIACALLAAPLTLLFQHGSQPD